MAPDIEFHIEMEAEKQNVAKKTETTTPRWCMQSRFAPPTIIPMVRPQLRGVDGSIIYEPHCVPVGPYHRNRSSPAVEKEKMRSVHFLQSLSEEHTKAAGCLAELMEELEPVARECYAADGDMTAEQFSSMLLHDGCYLLHLFVHYVSTSSSAGGGDRSRTPPPGGGHVSNTLVRDTVFLLENQVPFFVLQRLHERVTGGATSLLDYVAGPVQELLQQLLFISKKPRPAAPLPFDKCSHLLHLVHAYFQPTVLLMPAAAARLQQRRRRRRLTGRWRRATEYQRYANLSFEPRELEDDDVETTSILDVQLRRGTLWIPRLRVDSSTWTILRNLMALEEQLPHRRRPVTAYCLFISHLACTVEDVQLLRRAGIVDHFLTNDDQVAQGFADLCRGVVLDVDDLDRNYLKPLWHELEERSDSRAQRCMGWFRHGHNARIAAAFLVAVILIACQVIQTFYAVALQLAVDKNGHNSIVLLISSRITTN